jgi:hypothetical protein
MPVVDPHPDSKDLREMVAYYREVADQPGDIFLLVDPSALDSATLDRYRELGITWLAMDVFRPDDGHEARIEQIRQGSPGA